MPNELDHYFVALHEEPGDTFRLFFQCEAESLDHAKEQAENAYPGCEVVNVSILTADWQYAPPVRLPAQPRPQKGHEEAAMPNCPNCGGNTFEMRGQQRTYHRLTGSLELDDWNGGEIEFDTDDDGTDVIYCVGCDGEFTRVEIVGGSPTATPRLTQIVESGSADLARDMERGK